MAEYKFNIDVPDFVKEINNTCSEYVRDAILTPQKIIKSEDVTVVIWNNGTKTVVRRSEDASDDIYTAFTAAVSEKVFGNNSRIKKILREKVVVVESERMKKKRMKTRKEKEEEERPQKILNEYEASSADKIIQAVENSFRTRRRRRRAPV